MTAAAEYINSASDNEARRVVALEAAVVVALSVDVVETAKRIEAFLMGDAS